jgi:iron complex transport system ATP-binding protein
MMPATELAISNLSVALRSRPALSDLSVSITGNGLVALAGPNGAGKSTLLKTVAGLLPSSHGEIRVDGINLRDLTPADRARRMAYVPQDRSVHWPLPVRAIVALGRLPHQGPRAQENEADRRAIERALVTMDAAHLATRAVSDLSGGERARVLMARALAQEPAILLADEPAAGLDPAHQWALFECLAVAAAQGMRVIVAMHDLTLVSRFATNIILLAEGKLAGFGAPASVLTPATLAHVYGIISTTVVIDGKALVVPIGVQAR